MLRIAVPPHFRTAVCCCHSREKLQHRTYIVFSNTSPVMQNISPMRRNSPVISQQRQFSRQTLAYYASPDFPPIGMAQTFLENVRDSTGLPWWASIVLTTISLRTVVTLPLHVYSSKILSKVERLAPDITETSNRLKVEVKQAMQLYDWDVKTARRQYNINMKRLVKQLYIRENCHPAKAGIVMIFQIPLWISLSFALRNMAGALPILGANNQVLVPALAYEGFLWFPNLLMCDTSLILPILFGIINLTNVEINTLKREQPTKFQKTVTNLVRGISIFMIPVAATVPSCMALYWTVSSFYGLSQNIALQFPSVRRTLHIPKSPRESDTPFQDMLEIAKVKYSKKPKSRPKEPE